MYPWYTCLFDQEHEYRVIKSFLPAKKSFSYSWFNPCPYYCQYLKGNFNYYITGLKMIGKLLFLNNI